MSGRRKIYCQRCMAANELNEELCTRCGTRLMIVVAPSASRFDGVASTSGGLEEHLLERVTAIENILNKIIDRVELIVTAFDRQAGASQLNKELLDTLVEVLSEAGVITRQGVEEAWQETYQKEHRGAKGGARSDNLRAKIETEYVGKDREIFVGIVREGFAELERGKFPTAMRALERAAALGPGNATLNELLGTYFFRQKRTAQAHNYLSNALIADPRNWRISLLLGLTCGDAGEPERARELLCEALRRGGPSFAAHCALGRLSAAESDWKAALAEFRLALAARPCPEAHYLLGLVNYHLGRDRTAQRQLLKAVEMDANYAAAFYLLGYVYTRLGERKRADKAFDTARSVEGRRKRDARKKLTGVEDAQPPTLFSEKGRGRRRIVTGGDERLAEALQDDALGNTVPR